ncbi:MAG: SurA N-terminal domain-containing protein [bacterium]|nr:SurA N-terminal domain-containing protein [bacterium]
MTRTRALIIFSLVVAGAAVVYAVVRGAYPIAVANGTTISNETYENKYAAALSYYQSALATYTDASAKFGEAERRELRRAVLEGLVEEALIHDELLRREPEELGTVVENKIAKALADPDFPSAARTLYGLTSGGARRYLLIPQAEREILEGRLFLENQELDAWLTAAKRSASVTLLVPGFSWKAGGVVAE